MDDEDQIVEEYQVFLVPKGMDFQGDWIDLGKVGDMRKAIRGTARKLWASLRREKAKNQDLTGEVKRLKWKLEQAGARTLNVARKFAREISAECPGARYDWKPKEACDCVGMTYRCRHAACWLEYLDGKESEEK